MFSLTTYNLHDCFLGYRFQPTHAGDTSPRATITGQAGTGFLPARLGARLSADFVEPDAERLALAARALRAPRGGLPDVLCLQEVEGMDALRVLRERHLGGRYRYGYLIDGRDPRGLDVALLSRFPILEVRPHLDERTRSGWLFTRECLDATLALPGGERLTVFVNHLRSRLVESEAERRRADAHRARQAQRIAELIEERFPGKGRTALYAVVGDLNDEASSRPLAPLFESRLLVDVVSRALPPLERWTYYERRRGLVEQVDHVLVSPALARRVRRVRIERRAIGYRGRTRDGEVLPRRVRSRHGEVELGFERFSQVEADPRRAASDHCPVTVWF